VCAPWCSRSVPTIKSMCVLGVLRQLIVQAFCFGGERRDFSEIIVARRDEGLMPHISQRMLQCKRGTNGGGRRLICGHAILSQT